MKRVFFAFGIILVVILLVCVFVLKVRNTSCSASNLTCPSDISTEVHSFQGRRLFGSQKALRNFLSNKPEVKSFSIYTSPLGDIFINLELRKADIALSPEGSSVFTLYTKEGVVVRESPGTTVPVVILKEQLPPEAVSFIVQLSWQLTTILPVQEMTVEGSSLKVVLRDGRFVHYPLSGDIDLLLGTTLATFSQLNLTDGKLIIDKKATEIHEIDLRFKNPVLR